MAKVFHENGLLQFFFFYNLGHRITYLHRQLHNRTNYVAVACLERSDSLCPGDSCLCHDKVDILGVYSRLVYFAVFVGWSGGGLWGGLGGGGRSVLELLGSLCLCLCT